MKMLIQCALGVARDVAEELQRIDPDRPAWGSGSWTKDWTEEFWQAAFTEGVKVDGFIVRIDQHMVTVHYGPAKQRVASVIWRFIGSPMDVPQGSLRLGGDAPRDAADHIRDVFLANDGYLTYEETYALLGRASFTYGWDIWLAWQSLLDEGLWVERPDLSGYENPIQVHLSKGR